MQCAMQVCAFCSSLCVIDSLPLDQFAEDLIHGWVLLTSVLQNLFNDLIALTLLFKVLSSLLLRHLGLELVYNIINRLDIHTSLASRMFILTGSDLVVAFTHGNDTVLGVEDFGALELRVEQVDLALTEVLAVLLVHIFLTVDVVADIIDLMLSLIDGSVQLHFLLSRMLQVLLQVGDLSGQFALRGTVLSVLLLDLGQILELDRLSFEDASFHVFDKDFLFLTEEIILELHPMDFLLHGDDLSLTDGRVKSILHLFLKLVLALPQKDLLLSVDDVNENVTLLLLKLRDLVL